LVDLVFIFAINHVQKEELFDQFDIIRGSLIFLIEKKVFIEEDLTMSVCFGALKLLEPVVNEEGG
jgi:hypothetical protein